MKIIIYYHTSCTSSKKLFSWLEKFNIVTDIYRVKKISKKDLICLLTYTNEGIGEIIKHKNQVNEEICWKLQRLETMRFDDAVEFLLQNTDLLRTPIVLDKNKYMVGYQGDTVRQFIPKAYRNRRYYD